jgi:hypothetical protein
MVEENLYIESHTLIKQKKNNNDIPIALFAFFFDATDA